MNRYASREEAYERVVYDAGACVLRWLEREIGPGRMTAFLRLLVFRNRHGVETKGDVLAALADTVPGFDMRRFLRIAHLSG